MSAGPGAPIGCNSPLLDPDFVDRALEMVKLGMRPSQICAALRITAQTWNNWKNRAEEGKEPYVSFMQRVAAAKAADAQEWIDKAKKAIEAKGDPKYYLKYLDVMHDVVSKPVEKKVVHSGGVAIAPAYDLDKLSDEEFQQWQGLVEKMKPTMPSELDSPCTIDLLPEPE